MKYHYHEKNGKMIDKEKEKGEKTELKYLYELLNEIDELTEIEKDLREKGLSSW